MHHFPYIMAINKGLLIPYYFWEDFNQYLDKKTKNFKS